MDNTDMPDIAVATGLIRQTQPLAMVYSPVQEWGEVYDADIALYRGTLFPGLDKPFLGAQKEEGND